MINERGWHLVTQLRKSIELLPGATSAGLFEGQTWTVIEVTTATDDSVYSLALVLGVDAPMERLIASSDNSSERSERWLYASAEQVEPGRGPKRSIVKFDIVGPRHQAEPSSEQSDPEGTASP